MSYKQTGEDYRERLLKLPREHTNSQMQQLLLHTYDFADYMADLHTFVHDLLEKENKDSSAE